MLTKNKRGIALNQAFGAVLALVLIAVLVIVAILLFVNLGDSFTNLASATSTNETVDMTTNTPQRLGNASLCNLQDFAVTAVFNETTHDVIPASNYTVTGDGTINNTDQSFPNNWLVSTSSNWGGDSCVATDNIIAQFGTYPTLIGLVGTIIFLGIVIGVLVASFVFGGRKAI